MENYIKALTCFLSSISCSNMAAKTGDRAASTALCAWYSLLGGTASVTSENFWDSKSAPRSSESLHSGTLNCTALDWPLMFTESATTETSQKIVSLSSG